MGRESGGGAPRQEMERMPKAPDMAKPLELLRANFWQYRGLSPERKAVMEKAFQADFAQLGEKEKKAVTLELQAIEQDIALYEDNEDPIALIREEETAERVRQVLERVGVVMSAAEGALEGAREELMRFAIGAVQYMGRKDGYAREVMDKSEDTKAAAERLLKFSDAIKDELRRLELYSYEPVAAPPKPSKRREARNESLWSDPGMTLFQQVVHNRIDMNGLIGFSTLDKLTSEYTRTSRSLDEAVNFADIEDEEDEEEV